MALLFVGSSIREGVYNCTFPIHNLSLTHRAIPQDSKMFRIGLLLKTIQDFHYKLMIGISIGYW